MFSTCSQVIERKVRRRGNGKEILHEITGGNCDMVREQKGIDQLLMEPVIGLLLKSSPFDKAGNFNQGDGEVVRYPYCNPY
jgi:hypothetical protein